MGRTGTLIAIDMALEQAAQENVVDIPAIVTKMRRQRMKMIQNSVREACNSHTFYCKHYKTHTYKQLLSPHVQLLYKLVPKSHTHFVMLHSADSLPMMTPNHIMWVYIGSLIN